MKINTKEPSAAYTCNEFREEMILLGLTNQLQNTKLSESDRKKLLKEIERLEKLVGI